MSRHFILLTFTLFLLVAGAVLPHHHKRHEPYSSSAHNHNTPHVRSEPVLLPESHSTLHLNHHNPNDNSASCITCDFVLGGILEAVQQNATMQHLEDLLHELCHGFETCDHLASKITHLLPNLAHLAEKQDYNSNDLCCMLNYCEVDCCSSDHQPEQIHLGYNEYERASVSWTTRKKVCSQVELEGVTFASDGSTNQVLYKETLKGFERTYTAGGWRGFLHFVPDLSPSTLVHRTASGDRVVHRYRVGCASIDAWSEWIEYRVGVHSKRLAVMGDMGMENSENTLKRLSEHLDDIDMIVLLGDQSYADGNQRKWDEFLRKFQPVFSKRPVTLITGNHEIAIIGISQLFDGLTGFPHRFLLPGLDMEKVPLEMGSQWYYSYNFGPIHFVAIDSESIYDTPLIIDKQVDFIEQDLKNVNRSETPFVVVESHRPFYCTQSGVGACDETQMSYMRGRVEHLFTKYHVDAVFSGHRHNMERSAFVAYDKVTTQDKAPVYIVSGAGGNRESMQHFGSKIPDYSRFRLTDERGFGMLSWNETALTWKQYTSKDDHLVDSIIVQKKKF